ncbi:MAG: DUF4956 domain-containing protein [Candidatus Pacebacteria bacterium]|jgi:uncharacterized membrane protein YhiD involved in acid resistance|nr:DUF4956 domain-containing protein [Candidatus Paceibacterota bacterium]MDP7466447.1 DUF4956 domain-containing protein [Candidatus Paceibacterota bacterium]|tara:strand:+ start:852 stop:1538 length:687 start_codon:yes stop_codon:yes gene_type:complete
MIENLFTIGDVARNFTIGHVVLNLLLTLVLVISITYVYKITHKGFSYSQHFASTLIIVSMVTSIIMMVIGNSLAIAFGLLGAFSIIRFRTVVKEVRDTGFIFLSLAMGMAVGTNNYTIAIASTVVMLAVIWLLYKTNFGSIHTNDYLLTFVVDSDRNPPDSFSGVFEKYLKNSMLLNITSKSGGHSSEMVYSVRFIDEAKSSELVREISKIEGVDNVHIISSKSDIEY